MDEPFYFSKIQFNESYHCSSIHHDITIFINLVQQELSVQRYRWHRSPCPAIQGTLRAEDLYHETDELSSLNLTLSDLIAYIDKDDDKRDTLGCACLYSTEHTNFKPTLRRLPYYTSEVTTLLARKLTDEEMKELLPLCDARKFESYRNKEMSMCDEGFIGYRDCFTVVFCGVSDSPLPMITLPMTLCYDPPVPTEPLYSYIINRLIPAK